MLLSRSAELRALVECSLNTARELLAQGTSTIESPEDPMLHKLVDTLEKVSTTSMHLPVPTHDRIVPVRSADVVRYLEVFENDLVSIGVFVLPPGGKIPLHDHPFMCVASKVLYGTLHVRCFDPVEEILTGVFTARETRRDTFHTGDMTMLFPNHCNIHSFEAGPEGCAVLDILLPPYDASQGRLCSYYADFTYPIDPSLMVLSPIVPPESFAIIPGDVELHAEEDGTRTSTEQAVAQQS